jgi:hypothetical protein
VRFSFFKRFSEREVSKDKKLVKHEHHANSAAEGAVQISSRTRRIGVFSVVVVSVDLKAGLVERSGARQLSRLEFCAIDALSDVGCSYGPLLEDWAGNFHQHIRRIRGLPLSSPVFFGQTHCPHYDTTYEWSAETHGSVILRSAISMIEEGPENS